MRIVFKNRELESIYRKGKEEGKPRYGRHIVKAFLKVMGELRRVPNTRFLINKKSFHFEALKHDRQGYYSIRINDQYRLIFKIIKTTVEVRIILENIEIYSLEDYH